MENYAANAYSTPTPASQLKPSRWIQFLSISILILGGFSCLTVVGAIIGVPMIFAGLRLQKGYKSFIQYSETGNANAMFETIENYHKFFKIFGIISLVHIIFFALYFIVIIVAITFGLTEYLDNIQNQEVVPKSFSPENF